MSKILQKSLSFLLLFTLMVSGSACAEEDAHSFRIEINRKPIPATGFLNEQNTPLLPFRGIGEHLGFQFHWDKDKKSVIAKNGSRTIELQNGSSTTRINNRILKISEPAQIHRGHLMIPPSFCAECFSLQIRRDSEKLFSIEAEKVPAVYTDVLRETSLPFEEIKDPQNYPPLREVYHYDEPISLIYQEAFTKVIWDGEYSYVIIGYGRKPGGGYSPKLRDVWINDKKEILVDSYLSSPPPGAITTLALSYPTIYLRFKNKDQLPVKVLMDPDERKADLKTDF